MGQSEIDQKHLEFACGDAMIWFRNIPKLTRSFIFQRLVDSITAQFRGHEIQLRQFEIKEIKQPTRWSLFHVTVNHHASMEISFEREVHDE